LQKISHERRKINKHQHSVLIVNANTSATAAATATTHNIVTQTISKRLMFLHE
jgi:hypothetical protein